MVASSWRSAPAQFHHGAFKIHAEIAGSDIHPKRPRRLRPVLRGNSPGVIAQQFSTCSRNSCSRLLMNRRGIDRRYNGHDDSLTDTSNFRIHPVRPRRWPQRGHRRLPWVSPPGRRSFRATDGKHGRGMWLARDARANSSSTRNRRPRRAAAAACRPSAIHPRPRGWAEFRKGQ